MSKAGARLLLSGYYGFDNFGDEAILQIFVQQWRHRRPLDVLRVLSARPRATAAAYGVEALQRASLGNIRSSIRNCDVFVSGGGGLLQSSTSLRSLLYYAGLIRDAKRQGRKAVIFDQGIGPLNFYGKQIVRRACAGVDLAIVRDNASAELVSSLLPGVPLKVGADPVFLAPTDVPVEAERTLRSEGIAADAKLVAVVVRPSHHLDRLAGEVARMADALATRYGVQVVFVPFQRPVDVEVSVSVIRRCRTAPALLGANYDLQAMLALFRRCDAIIGMRLHSLILAARLCIPFIAIGYDPKIGALLESLQYPLPMVGQEESDTLLSRMWSQRAALVRHLEQANVPLIARAAQSFDWLESVVEGAVS